MSAPQRDAIAEQFGVSRESLEQLDRYVELLIRWNQAINLIADARPDHIWRRHIADSLQLKAYLDPGRAFVDIGSGAGLPGLVLAITRNDVERDHGFLIESNRKKAAFLVNAVRHTGALASVIPRRVEAVIPEELMPQPRYVIARAVAPLTKLIHLAEPFIRLGAVGVFLKGQDVESELTEASKSWRIDAELYPSQVDESGHVILVRHAAKLV